MIILMSPFLSQEFLDMSLGFETFCVASRVRPIFFAIFICVRKRKKFIIVLLKKGSGKFSFNNPCFRVLGEYARDVWHLSSTLRSF